MTPEEHRDFLLDFLLLVYRLIEEAVPETRSWFEERREEIEPFQFAHTVRYMTKRGIQGLESSSFRTTLAYLPNNGLEIYFERFNRRYCIKIYKGVHGLLPAPGPSESKRRFWEQASLFPEDTPAVYNVAVIWNVDPFYNLVDLQLVRPALIGGEQQIGQQLWALAIPHPAEMMSAPPPLVALVLEEDIDLDSYDQRADENEGEDGSGTTSQDTGTA